MSKETDKIKLQYGIGVEARVYQELTKTTKALSMDELIQKVGSDKVNIKMAIYTLSQKQLIEAESKPLTRNNTYKLTTKTL